MEWNWPPENCGALLFLCFSIKQGWRDEGVFGKWNSSWLVARLLHPPSLTSSLHYHTDEFSALHSAFLHCLLCLCIRLSLSLSLCLSLSLSLCPSPCKCLCLCFCPELPALQNRTDEFLHYTALCCGWIGWYWNLLTSYRENSSNLPMNIPTFCIQVTFLHCAFSKALGSTGLYFTKNVHPTCWQWWVRVKMQKILPINCNSQISHVKPAEKVCQERKVTKQKYCHRKKMVQALTLSHFFDQFSLSYFYYLVLSLPEDGKFCSRYPH